MYKSGKNWVVAPIVFLGLTAGLGYQANVKADNVSSSAGSNSENTQQSKASSLSSQNSVSLKSSSASTQAQSVSKEETVNFAVQPQSTTKTATSSSKASSSASSSSQVAANAATANEKDNLAVTDQQNNQTAQDQTQSNPDQQKNQNATSSSKKDDAVKADTTTSSSNSASSSSSSVQSQKVEQAQEHDDAVQINQNGQWFLQNKETHQNYTGFQYIKDQNKTVYYNPTDGAMVYGQQKINNQWYYFDKITGAMKLGYYWIAEQQKEVYYDPNKGNMVYGQQKIDGKWQYFDGVTGAQAKNQYVWIANQNKEVYYDGLGNMVYGQQNIKGKWQWFDTVTGAQAKNQYVGIGNQNKEVYYDGLGNMVYGQQYINGHWQWFDTVTGAQAKNQFVDIKDQNKTVYYDGLGNMVYGWQSINNGNYYFNTVTGALEMYRGNELPASLDSSSINEVDGYLTWDGWFRPTQYHQDGKTWVNSGVTDWRPILMYAWPSKNIEIQYIQYFTNHGYNDSSLGLTSDAVKSLSDSTPDQIVNNYAENMRDSIEKQIYKDNYSTTQLANTMKDFMATIPDFSLASELPVEDQPGYHPDNSGSIDNDQIIFVNNDSNNQKVGNTSYADSNYRLMNHTITNEGGYTNVNDTSPELLLGIDIDNSNPVVQAENLNWEYFLLHYSTIMGQGDDGNFDGFRVDAADNIDADVLLQLGQLMNDMYHTKGSNANADSHLVYDESYHSNSAQLLNEHGNPQLYMDSGLYWTLNNVLGAQPGSRNNIMNIASNSVVNRTNDTTENQATPNWSFVNNHDQQKNIINQIIIDDHPGVTDIMAAGYKAEYADEAWKQFYEDEAQTVKKYTQYNVPAKYAILLTNKDTVPEVYYGDLYNETDPYMQSKGMYYNAITTMLQARKKYVSGGQSMTKYNDNLMASVRYGKNIMNADQTNNDSISRTSGIAVIVGNNPSMDQQTITVSMGKEHANQKYVNLIGTTVSGLSYNNGETLTTDANGDLHITVKGYANPYVSGYLSVWVPDGAAADQNVTTEASTAQNTSGKTYQSNAALDSHVIFEDFSLFQPHQSVGDDTYTTIAKNAQQFANLGITDFWFAPPYQSFSMSRYDEGYAITDRYDLGQSSPTKYGTNIEMINAVKALHKVGISAQVDLVMNQLLGLSGKEVVTGTRTDNHGQQLTVGGKTFANKLYVAYVDGGGKGQQQYGGAYLDYLKQNYPDLFTTKAISTGVAPDPNIQIKQWSAKYENGTSLQGTGMGLVAQAPNGDYYYLNNGKNDKSFPTTVPTQFTQSNYWVQDSAQPGWHMYGTSKYYINPNGSMALGHQTIDGKDYYFNPQGGQLVSVNGQPADGQKLVNGHWQYFDPVTGVQAKNQYVWLADQNKEVYYDANGNMVYGQQNINGHWQYFNPVTGAQAKNQYVWIADQNKEVYYDGLGNMVYGQQKINGKSQYFDPVTGAQVKNKYVCLGQNKWAYYDGLGNMVYGQQHLNGHWQYFDPTTGVQAKNQYVWIADQNKEVYYDNSGNMVYGWQTINGYKHYFDPVTGAQAKNETLVIDGKKYKFDGLGNIVE